MDRTLIALGEEPGPWLPSRRLEDLGWGRLVVIAPRAAVERLRLGDDVEAAVEELRELARAQALEEVTWWVGALATPPDLGDRLERLGFLPQIHARRR